MGVEGKKGGFGMWAAEDEANNVFFNRILIWKQRSIFQDGASLSFLLALVPQRQSLICPAQSSRIRLHLS